MLAEQRLACDVTGNGSLSGLDAALILRLIVGLITRFPVAAACDSDWVFFPDAAPASNAALIQPQPGAVSCRPGALAYPPLTGSFSAQNFSALLFGDCTADWQPAGGNGAAPEGPANSPAVRAGPLRRLRGSRLALPIHADTQDPVAGLDVLVAYDSAALNVVSARTVGRARGAALAVNAREPGIVRIALARGVAIDARSRPLLIVLFESRRRGGVAALSLTGRVATD